MGCQHYYQPPREWWYPYPARIVIRRRGRTFVYFKDRNHDR